MGRPKPAQLLDSRPLRRLTAKEIEAKFEAALAAGAGEAGAHCVHELWMRGAIEVNVEQALERLWERACDSIPEWLPMRYVDWLPLAYEVAARFEAIATGRTHLYLVLLDYSDSRPEPYGVYVGMSSYKAALRFDQHKAGIKAAGSVLKRGIEVLTGPVMHLQYISRAEATRIERELAEALREAGIFVKGGH